MAQESLTELLRRAATEPAARPAFYDALLASTVYVIGRVGDDASATQGEATLAAGDQVQLQNWNRPDGSPVIPFFSSLDTLRQGIAEECPYLALPARSLFEMTQGAELVLDPGSDYGKEFTPDEIGNLLASGLSRSAKTRTVEKSTQVLLGQPAQPPEAMMASLRALFSQRPQVSRAFLALMHDGSAAEPPHLVIGIETDDEDERVFQEAGNVAADQARGEPVDLVRVSGHDEGIASYFLRDCPPFYRRETKKRGFFASLFGRS
ncbi:enhanced serine sensitivity protein SseB C-terminal domain-containing protein [Arenimonas sp.]|uniref:enhanced serine sensitivity protein SseB C-terminal domain-containing protein n=1 Tax=Arenimonas sp. TaxID=1872635 RepID=UPI0039E6570E